MSTDLQSDPRDDSLPASSSGRPGLHIENLSKRYKGGALANDGLRIDIEPGEIFGLLGPNGAGKTTLVKQIIGLLEPTQGSIWLDGTDLVAKPAIARQLCSLLPQGQLPIVSLKLREAIELVGRIRGGDRRSVRRRADQLIETLELEEWADTVGMKLSGGVQRLTGFAMACVWPTRLVILDEPTNDVDPLRRRLLWQLIRGLGKEGTAVLLVTHNVLEAEQVVDRLAIIDGGRIIEQGTPAFMKREDRDHLRLRLSLVPGSETPELPSFALSHTQVSRRLFLTIEEHRASEAIRWAQTMMADGVIEEYALAATTLEDVYLRLVGRDDALEAPSELEESA